MFADAEYENNFDDPEYDLSDVDDGFDWDSYNDVPDESGICSTCNGSGEGSYDGSVCPTCRGK
jgi:hypothetical protein